MSGILMLPATGTAQERVDSLARVVVTATLHPASVDNVPARVTVTDSMTLATAAITNTDEVLVTVPGVLVNRSWGIFSKNSAVTMRGLNGSARVLTLLDGVPLNLSGGGGINWHLLGPEQISRIEVLNGPASALYGQNAMGGVIQLFTRQKPENASLRIGGEYGSYGTAGIGASWLQPMERRNGWIAVGGFSRAGDGYILTPEDLRTPYDTLAWLREASGRVSGGLDIAPGHHADFSCIIQGDRRGSGTRVYEENGAFVQTGTGLFSARFKGTFTPSAAYSVVFYSLMESTFTVDEKVNNQDAYKLADIFTYRRDAGMQMHITRPFHAHLLTAGADFRSGILEGSTQYRSATDSLGSGGHIAVASIFLQDECELIPEKLMVQAGLRYDAALFNEGFLAVENPTGETGFAEDTLQQFPSGQWGALSPKLGLRYRFSPKHSLYLSAGQGFSAPKLNDLTSSGKIRRGFKLANPALEPEWIWTVETGGNLSPAVGLHLNPTVFYSFARSLQYQVSTGDSMEVTGEMKPVLQVRNVAGMKVAGAEMRIEWFLRKAWYLYGAYSFSQSLLMTADAEDSLVRKLDGKFISEVPAHLASAGLMFRMPAWFARIDWSYTGELWYDDENLILTEAFHQFNLKAGCLLHKNWFVSLTVQDLFDHPHIDKKGLLSPGRYITAGIRYQTDWER